VSTAHAVIEHIHCRVHVVQVGDECTVLAEVALL
jgi:hypothetical protein